MSRTFISEYVAEMNEPGAENRIALAREYLERIRMSESLNIGNNFLSCEIFIESGISRFVINGNNFYLNILKGNEIIELIFKIKENFNKYKDLDAAQFAIDQLIRNLSSES